MILPQPLQTPQIEHTNLRPPFKESHSITISQLPTLLKPPMLIRAGIIRIPIRHMRGHSLSSPLGPLRLSLRHSLLDIGRGEVEIGRNGKAILPVRL